MVHMDPLAWKEGWDELVVQRPVMVSMHILGWGVRTTVGLAPFSS